MTRPLLTIVTVRDRVMALCARIELPAPLGLAKGVHKDVTECSFTAASLPTFVVRPDPRGGDYTYNDADQVYATAREIHISLYIGHIHDESYARDLDMIDLAEIAAATVVQYFAARPHLEMDNDHGVVDQARLARGGAPHPMATKGSTNKNRGIQFRMPVIFRNRALQDSE